MRTAIPFLLLASFLNSCGATSSSSSSQASNSVAPLNENENGEMTTTVKAGAAAVIAASGLTSAVNDPLAQYASINIPAGALMKSTDIKIYEAESLADQIEYSVFGLTTLDTAGPTIVIAGDSTALGTEIIISVPYDQQLLLTAQSDLAVLVLDGNTATIIQDIVIKDKVVEVKMKKFAAFQAVKVGGAVQQNDVAVAVSSEALNSALAVAQRELSGTWERCAEAASVYCKTISIQGNKCTVTSTIFSDLSRTTEIQKDSVSFTMAIVDRLENGYRELTLAGAVKSTYFYKITGSVLSLATTPDASVAEEYTGGTGKTPVTKKASSSSTATVASTATTATKETETETETSTSDSPSIEVTIEGTWLSVCYEPESGFFIRETRIMSAGNMTIETRVYSEASCTSLVSTTTATATYTLESLAATSGNINIVFDGGSLLFDSYEIANDNMSLCFGNETLATGATAETRRSSISVDNGYFRQ